MQLEYDEQTPTTLCVVQSFLNTYSSIASFLWTVAVAVYLYLTLVRRNVIIANGAVIYMHIVCWSCPALAASLAAGMGQLGYDTTLTPGWCWLRSSAGLGWVLFAGKGWELSAYIITPVLYFLIKRAISRDTKDLEENTLLVTAKARKAGVEADRKLAFVPLVFLLLRIWGTVRSVLYLTGQEYDIFPLIILQVGSARRGWGGKEE